MQLHEVDNLKARAKGDPSIFRKHTFADPELKKLVASLEAAAGKPLMPEFQAAYDKEMAGLDEVQKKAPLLYGTMVDMQAENTIFKYIQKNPKIAQKATKGAGPTFNTVTFLKLLRTVKAENSEFFPLRSVIDSKYLHSPIIVFSPDPNRPEYNDVDTAAATATGHFIFNKDFMQSLLDYAHLYGVKPKSKKYENNGGDIPPEWCFIEFLIIHELMHYTHDDFYYTKIYKADPQIINWVGDFRNNYTMTKIGIEHLPMGLYNDHINYDRQKSYREMYDLVKAEFDKLSDPAKKKVKDKLGDMGDDHSGHHKEPDSKDGDPTEGDLDEHAKRQGKALDKRKDGEKPKPTDGGQGKPGHGAGGRGKSDNPGKIDPWDKVRPTFNWKTLLSKFVAKAKPDEEETYAKPSRKAISGVSQAVQVGAAVMKPSEQPLNPKVSLAAIVDSSGSMHNDLPKIYSNLDQLMKGNNVSEIRLTKFSGSQKHYALWPKKKAYSEMQSPKEKPRESTSGSLSDLFSQSLDGSTDFDDDVKATMHAYASLGLNQLIVSDSDILYGDNLTTLKEILKTIPNVFIIFSNAEVFKQACKALGNVSPNFSHL